MRTMTTKTNVATAIERSNTVEMLRSAFTSCLDGVDFSVDGSVDGVVVVTGVVVTDVVVTGVVVVNVFDCSFISVFSVCSGMVSGAGSMKHLLLMLAGVSGL